MERKVTFCILGCNERGDEDGKEASRRQTPPDTGQPGSGRTVSVIRTAHLVQKKNGGKNQMEQNEKDLEKVAGGTGENQSAPKYQVGQVI